MDNLTHTMAGALLAESGLKDRSRWAYPALLIGANLPDIDIVSLLVGDSVTALAFRRGWTHGVLAMVVLPFILTLLLITWSRAMRQRSSVEVRASAPPVPVTPLLLVSAIGILSHPLLDLVNNYGVRLLMPFSERWFYGDAIYIVDPWLLLLLLTGAWAARRSARRGGAARNGTARGVARLALALVVTYIGAMTYISRDAVRLVAREAGIVLPVSPRVLMMSPEPVWSATRTGLRDTGASYERWRVDWRPWGSRVRQVGEPIPIGADDPRAMAARGSAEGELYLRWTRFPFFVSGVEGDPTLVHLGDARYSIGADPAWSTIRVRVAATSPSPSADSLLTPDPAAPSAQP